MKKIFSFKAEEIKKIIFQGSIIENTSNKILEEIKDCIGTKLYEYVIKNEENKVKEKMNINFKNIYEHIFSFEIYEKFFIRYLLSKLTSFLI